MKKLKEMMLIFLTVTVLLTFGSVLVSAEDALTLSASDDRIYYYAHIQTESIPQIFRHFALCITSEVN